MGGGGFLGSTLYHTMPCHAFPVYGYFVIQSDVFVGKRLLLIEDINDIPVVVLEDINDIHGVVLEDINNIAVVFLEDINDIPVVVL